MKKFLVITILAVFMGSGLKAQMVPAAALGMDPTGSEYTQTLKKFMEVSGALTIFKNMVPSLFKVLQKQIPNVPAEVWAQLEKENTPPNLLDDIVKAFVPAYEKMLTQEDLEELIKFYETPIGQKLAKAQPMIMQGTMQVAQQVQRPISMKVQKALQAQGYLPAAQ